MADKIKLTPQELKAQAVELKNIQAEVSSLYDKIIGDLQTVNGSWSANLANNFLGKITSTKKVFTDLSESLLKGAEVAENSAMTFESVDSGLAKAFLGIAGAGGSIKDAAEGAVSGDSEGKISFWDCVKEQFRQLPEDIKQAGEALGWLEDQYGKLPQEARDLINKLCPGDLKEAYSLTSQLLQGKLGMDDLYSVIGYLTEGSTEGKVVISSIKYAINTGIARDKKNENDAYQNFREGDIIGGIYDMGEAFIDTIGGGVIDILADVGGGIIDGVVGKIPGGSYLVDKYLGGKSLGSYVVDCGRYISNGLDKVTDVISDGVNAVTDGLKTIGRMLFGK